MVCGSERCDTAWLAGHGIPGVLAGIEEVGIGGENAVAEEVVFELLPGFFSGIAVRRVGRRRD